MRPAQVRVVPAAGSCKLKWNDAALTACLRHCRLSVLRNWMPGSSHAGSLRPGSAGLRRPSPSREARLQELLERERLKDEISKGLQARTEFALFGSNHVAFCLDISIKFESLK